MNGAQWLARALAGTGMTHVFFVELVLRRTLLEFDDLGVTRILAHSEKAAAYMADGYARVMGKPGVCMAQSVGAANLASGLQDAWLGRSPVVALTGRKEPSFQHRNSYQEIPHAPLFAAVTKFSAPVDSTAELPRLLAPRLARRTRRHAAAHSSRLLRLAGRRHRTWPNRRAAGHRPGDAAHPGTPAGRRYARHRTRRCGAERARRIVIIAGEGAAASQAGPEVLALAEALAAPIATSLGARGIIPTRHRAAYRRARQLFRTAYQPHRSFGRSGPVCRLRYRRSGHP